MATTIPHATTDRSPATDSARHRVVVLDGDGIGPEIMRAARAVLAAVEAPVELVDAQVDRSTGLPEAAVFDELDAGAVLLKAPMTTPIGAGHKSPNVTLRKLLELYANVRPSRTLPGLAAPCGPVDVVVVRENIEDLYAGIEHAQTDDVLQCLKLVSRSGSAAISKLAFDVAESLGRERVTCVTKANIMKLTDGVLLDAYRAEAARRGADPDHVLVDAAACDLVRAPERFDVLVTTNLYGDILSDLAAGLTGGLGIAPSMNVGSRCAMFEPVHGSAPDIAGRDLANPTAMLLSTVLMLRYLGDPVGADAIQRAIDDVYLEGRVRTADVAAPGVDPVGSTAFAYHVATRAAELCDRDTADQGTTSIPSFARRATGADEQAVTDSRAVEFVAERRAIGVDVFVEWDGDVEALASSLQAAAAPGPLRLWYITNRGLCVWPTAARARLVDHFRCRFVVDAPDASADERDVLELLERVGRDMRWMHVERLEEHDGEHAFTTAYGAPAA